MARTIIMHFDAASQYIMPKLRYAGLTLSEISRIPGGLCHLEFARRRRVKQTKMKVALDAFMANPGIQRAYEKDRDRSRSGRYRPRGEIIRVMKEPKTV